MSVRVHSFLFAGLALSLASCSSKTPKAEDEGPAEKAVAEVNMTAPVAAPDQDVAADKAKQEADKVALKEKEAADKLAADKLAKANAANAAVKEPVKVAVAMAAPTAFGRCAVCHDASKGGADKLGPHLFGIMGAKAGAHAPGFAYSDALKASGLRWDTATMDKWLENPRGLVPGNRMSFPGLKDAAKRAEIIAYLQSLK